jgi:pimeloyl-ACP methyl ester carboxylesterase
LNEDRYRTAGRTFTSPDFPSARRWLFYYDDVDVERFETTSGDQLAPWASATVPRAVIESVLTPGVIAPEAAAVRSPVLVAMGERDVIADPKGEPRAYLSAMSVDLFVCPSMGHMHNFASTRELFWQRIDTWGRWVAAHSAAAR